MLKYNKKYKRITFGFILLSAISFPPMTLYLILNVLCFWDINNFKSAKAIKRCGQCLLWVWFILMLIFIISDAGDTLSERISSMIILSIYYLIMASIFLKRAKVMNAFMVSDDSLYSHIKNENITGFADLAEKSNVTYTSIVLELESLQRSGLLDITLDYDNSRVIIAQTQEQSVDPCSTQTNISNESNPNTIDLVNSHLTGKNKSEDLSAFKTIVCVSCGAKKQISIGKKDKCDFCDSPMDYVN